MYAGVFTKSISTTLFYRCNSTTLFTHSYLPLYITAAILPLLFLQKCPYKNAHMLLGLSDTITTGMIHWTYRQLALVCTTDLLHSSDVSLRNQCIWSTGLSHKYTDGSSRIGSTKNSIDLSGMWLQLSTLNNFYSLAGLHRIGDIFENSPFIICKVACIDLQQVLIWNAVCCVVYGNVLF